MRVRVSGERWEVRLRGEGLTFFLVRLVTVHHRALGIGSAEELGLLLILSLTLSLALTLALAPAPALAPALALSPW